MCKTVLSCAAVVICLASTLISAQDRYFANWFNRVDKTQAEQPHWITPLATTTPRLEEEFRYDQLWQENAKGVTTDNYDGGKGLELIPFEKVEVIFNLPPYIDHNSASVRNGWGDVGVSGQVPIAFRERGAWQLHIDGVSRLEPAHGFSHQRRFARGHHPYDCVREGLRPL
jgi:hypothetical protein